MMYYQIIYNKEQNYSNASNGLEWGDVDGIRVKENVLNCCCKVLSSAFNAALSSVSC